MDFNRSLLATQVQIHCTLPNKKLTDKCKRQDYLLAEENPQKKQQIQQCDAKQQLYQAWKITQTVITVRTSAGVSKNITQDGGRGHSLNADCLYRKQQGQPIKFELSMGKHKGKAKVAPPRHKLSKSSRFEAAWNGTEDFDGDEMNTRGKC